MHSNQRYSYQTAVQGTHTHTHTHAAFASQVLGLQVQTTTPNYNFSLWQSLMTLNSLELMIILLLPPRY